MSAVKMLRLDLLSMKVYAKSYLIFLIYPVVFFTFGVVGMGAMCAVMFAMMGGSIFSLQEKNRLERLYSIVAISEKSVVQGRYLFELCNCMVVLLVVLPVQYIASTVAGQRPEPAMLLIAAGLSFFLFWFVAGIQAPLYFRYGYTKMRMIAYIPILVFAVGPFLLLTLFAETLGDKLETAVETVFSQPVTVLLAGLGLGAAIAVSSYFISMRGYRRAKG